MEAVDILAALGLAVGGILAGAAFNLMAPPHDLHAAAKACFIVAAIIVAATGLMWGMSTHTDTVIRIGVCGLFGAVALIGAVEGWRLASGRAAATAATPAPIAPQQGRPPSASVSGNNTGVVAGEIHGDVIVHNEHTPQVVQIMRNEGKLYPAHDPITSINTAYPISRTPESDLKIVLGKSLFWTSTQSQVILMMANEPMIAVARNGSDNSLIVTIIRIFDDRNNIIARLDEDGFWVEPNARMKRPDKSTLVVFDHNDHEVLRIRYANRLTVCITGIFRHSGIAGDLEITPEKMLFQTNEIILSGPVENQKAAFAIG